MGGQASAVLLECKWQWKQCYLIFSSTRYHLSLLHRKLRGQFVTLPYTLEQTDRQTDRQNQDWYCCVWGSPFCCQRGFQELQPSAPPTDNPPKCDRDLLTLSWGSLWPCRLVSSGNLTRFIQSWFELVDPRAAPGRGGRRTQPRLLRNNWGQF